MAETVTSVCGIAVDDLVLKIEEFHGYRSPGILIGSRMIETWFERNRGGGPKPPFDDMAAEILSAESDLLPCRNIHLLKSLKNDRPVPTRACPDCGEFYPEPFGDRCPSCREDAYYR